MITQDKFRGSLGRALFLVFHGSLPLTALPEFFACSGRALDGAEMILVPAGEFLIGSPAGEGDDDEHPRHRVYLDAYYLYRYPVTNGQFARFA
ncbi:MAG: formylglycine-generating enzyme family protein [Candidatus Xenobiia bacterium LiM19]